jgi:glycosyltransferase involved in cell wall biosynthesis
MNIDRIDAPADIAQLVDGRPITNLMYLIWQNRKDLQEAFDIHTRSGQEDFANWCVVAVEREYGISPVGTGDAGDRLAQKDGQRDSLFTLILRLQSRLSGGGQWLPKAVRNRVKKYWLRFLSGIAPSAVTGSKEMSAAVDASGISEAKQNMGDPGVNLVGYANAELGMGEHVRMSAAAFSGTDVKYGIVDFQVGVSSRKQAQLNHGSLISSNVYKANLFHINADQMLTAFCHLGREFFSNRYNIGYWLWELSKCPDEWLPVMGLVDEVWAPSRFIQRAFAERSCLPVEYMPLCVQVPPLKGYNRNYYDLPEDRFLFLFAFDFFSFMDRKNPFAIIKAFKQAFPEMNTRIGLVIKIMNGDPNNQRWKDMCNMIGDDTRVFIYNKVMTRDEIIGLIDSCNCFVSLHRSEGFGFGPAEAMYLGKPVIVTNYSGNTDFTLPDNSCLVDYRLIPVIEGQYVFDRDQVWADPDIEHAAWYMRRLASQDSYGMELGKKAAAFIRENHSPARIGSLYRERLKALHLI